MRGHRLDLGIAALAVRTLDAKAQLLTNGPVLYLNAGHREVARIPRSQHCIGGVCRCSDQTVRLRQRNAKGGELPPPFTSLLALRSPNRQDAETIEQLFCRCCFRRAQSADDFLNIDG